MFSFKSSEDVLSLSEFRAKLSECVAQCRTSHRPLLLTQNGRAAGVFVDACAWDELQEKLEKMEAYEDLLVAEGEADRGETVSLEDFEKDIKSRRAKEDRRRKSKTARNCGNSFASITATGFSTAARRRAAKFCPSATR